MSSFSSYRIFKMKYKIILFSSLFLLFSNTYAQETGEDKLGSWYMYSGTHKVSDKLSINSGAQVREYETTTNLNTLLILTGLSYNINSTLVTTMGYGYLTIDGSYEDLPNENNTHEHRLYEQISLKNKIWKFRLEHRYRMEQRFLDYTHKTDTQHRTRYRLQVTLPLTDIFFLNVYDEIFLNLQNDIFNQNRLYTALGVKITENSKVQLGYLKNTFNNAAFDRLQIGISIHTDFRKKKEQNIVADTFDFNTDNHTDNSLISTSVLSE